MSFFTKRFVQKYTITSSSITTSPVIVVPPMNSGDIMIENIILTTDATGLAGGTNLELTTDSTFGRAAVMTETVANLGANKTVDFSNASIAGAPTVISDGGAIYINSTIGACTGAGKLNVYVYCRQATPGADILGQNSDI